MALLLPFLHPKFGAFPPTSLTFRLVTVPLVALIATTKISGARNAVNKALGTNFTGKWSDLITRDGLILFGVFEMLTQLFLIPLITPSKGISPQMAKFTFATPMDLPNMIYVVVLLYFLSRFLSKQLCGSVSAKSKEVKALVQGSCVLIGFLLASIAGNSLTPLDFAVPATLTALSFAMPAFDSLSQTLFGTNFPVVTFSKLFDSDFDDWTAIGTVFSVWFGATVFFGHKLPGYKTLNEMSQKLFWKESNLLQALIQFGTLFMLPMTIKRLNPQRPQLGYMVGFVTGLLIFYANPARAQMHKLGIV